LVPHDIENDNQLNICPTSNWDTKQLGSIKKVYEAVDGFLRDSINPGALIKHRQYSKSGAVIFITCA
jgi:hypothetical protein